MPSPCRRNIVTNGEMDACQRAQKRQGGQPIRKYQKNESERADAPIEMMDPPSSGDSKECETACQRAR